MVPPWRPGAPARRDAGKGRRAWHGVPPRQFHPSPAEGGGCHHKGSAPVQRGTGQVLGRSGGGYGTKACVIGDGAGRAAAFALAPSQGHELPHAVPRLERRTGVLMSVVADLGYSSRAFRQHVGDLGARPAIPPKVNEAPVACPEPIYNNRNRVERPWAGLKDWRAVATRYEKTATSFLGVLCLSATPDRVNRSQAMKRAAHALSIAPPEAQGPCLAGAGQAMANCVPPTRRKQPPSGVVGPRCRIVRHLIR